MAKSKQVFFIKKQGKWIKIEELTETKQDLEIIIKKSNEHSKSINNAPNSNI